MAASSSSSSLSSSSDDSSSPSLSSSSSDDSPSSSAKRRANSSASSFSRLLRSFALVSLSEPFEAALCEPFEAEPFEADPFETASSASSARRFSSLLAFLLAFLSAFLPTAVLAPPPATSASSALTPAAVPTNSLGGSLLAGASTGRPLARRSALRCSASLARFSAARLRRPSTFPEIFPWPSSKAPSSSPAASFKAWYFCRFASRRSSYRLSFICCL